MRLAEIYHHYSNIEHEARLPRQLKNQNESNEEKNYREGSAKQIQRLGELDQGRKNESVGKK
jgi:hypothetical protein